MVSLLRCDLPDIVGLRFAATILWAVPWGLKEHFNLVFEGELPDGTTFEIKSIRATIQARKRKKLFLHDRPVYPLPTHYCQTWQYLPDYGAYHAALIADPALPGKWRQERKWFTF